MNSVLGMETGGQQTEKYSKANHSEYVYCFDHCLPPLEGKELLGYPDRVNNDHCKDTKRANDETSAAACAKRHERNHAAKRTDDEENACYVDGPEPDAPGIEAFV